MALKPTLIDSLRSLKSLLATSGEEEPVKVNQKSLIDKMLSRYSSDYFVYRELMQNADDASSNTVSIRFITSKSKSEIVFENDGEIFNSDDWERLKSIADGNPDVRKIGAFGVGFYSVFSICHEPTVVSGAQCMSFKFKGDQLFIRTKVRKGKQNRLTAFYMGVDSDNIPELDAFSRFLATSM
ncbi:histidine kinase-like ATPase, partial [Jimgerdemannia flammicorona]